MNNEGYSSSAVPTAKANVGYLKRVDGVIIAARTRLLFYGVLKIRECNQALSHFIAPITILATQSKTSLTLCPSLERINPSF